MKKVQLYVMAVLLKPAALLKIETKLASGSLQIPFQGEVVKSYRYTNMNIKIPKYVFNATFRHTAIFFFFF